MSHNPKVVSFDRSAAYVHHRALKNMRDNNPVDALELMRQAVEHSPGNQEYLLDLAEMYCEMGCHEQSNRILLDMLAQGKNAPAECYYGLALNQFGRNEFESARQALLLYCRHAGNGEYLQEAGGLTAEIEFIDSMKRPVDRKLNRAAQVANRACDALREDDPRKACRLFERSFQLHADQPEMRALYAMALRMLGDEQEAIAQARWSVSGIEPGVRALCVAAQVFYNCGLIDESRQLAQRAIQLRPMGTELRLMIFALGEMDMPVEAADALRFALRETPHDKMLLHMRAVALHRAGAPDDQVAPFWLRILRIDPRDSVARYYHEAALQHRLGEIKPGYIYDVPGDEYRRRLLEIADVLGEGLEKAIERWHEDAGFRSVLNWAVGTGDESCGRAAMMVIASAGDEASESDLRELLYRGDVPLPVKMHALVFLRLRGADVEKFIPPGMNMQDGLLPEPESILKDMPACERQLVRFAGDVLENCYGVRAVSALAVLWYAYKQGCDQDNDPLLSTQEAAAALAWNYLLQHGMRASVKELARQFECRERRMIFYARRMAAVLENNGRIQDHEDH